MGWGQWHEGNTYDVRTFHNGQDTYPEDFRCRVEVRVRATGIVTEHKGKGKFIGNFSPIWIKFNGKEVQLTELLRE